MNINERTMDDFVKELLREQTAMSQAIANSTKKGQLLKNISDLNRILSLVLKMKDSIAAQAEA